MIDVEPSDDFVRHGEIKKIVDGDTIRVIVDLGWTAKLQEDIRLSWLNCPESQGIYWVEHPAGQYVTKKVCDWVGKEKKIKIRSRVYESGRYGRCICEAWVSGRQLNRLQIVDLLLLVPKLSADWLLPLLPVSSCAWIYKLKHKDNKMTDTHLGLFLLPFFTRPIPS